MKKHLWLVGTAVLMLLVITVHAKLTRKTVIRDTVYATNTAASADSSVGSDTITPEGDGGRWGKVAYNLLITQSDSLGSAVPVDTLVVRVKAQLGLTYTTLDSFKTAMSAAGITVNRQISFADSAGYVTKLRGDKIHWIISLADTVDIGASLGSDSVLTYPYTLTTYFAE